jgi:hypothetical protein
MYVQVYTKVGCSLCDEALALLGRVLQGQPHRLEEIDIYTSAELFERYRHEVPVVRIDGADVLRLKFTEADVRRAVDTRRATVESGKS